MKNLLVYRVLDGVLYDWGHHHLPLCLRVGDHITAINWTEGTCFEFCLKVEYVWNKGGVEREGKGREASHSLSEAGV